VKQNAQLDAVTSLSLVDRTAVTPRTNIPTITNSFQRTIKQPALTPLDTFVTEEATS